MGMYPLAFFAIVIIVPSIAAIILWLWYNQKQRSSHTAQARGKLLCEFCSPEGAYSVLCDVWKGQVKKIESSSRASFTVDRMVKAPKGHDQSIDVYYVLQDHCFPVRWPEGKPATQQIIVMKTHYLVNDPVPKITYNPDKWNPEVYDRTTSALAKYAQDEKNMQILVSELGGIWRKVEEFINYLRRVPLILIIELVLALLIIITIFFAYRASANSAAIINFLTGGK